MTLLIYGNGYISRILFSTVHHFHDCFLIVNNNNSNSSYNNYLFTLLLKLCVSHGFLYCLFTFILIPLL